MTLASLGRRVIDQFGRCICRSGNKNGAGVSATVDQRHRRFEDQADSLAKLSMVSIAYSQRSSVAVPSVSSWLTVPSGRLMHPQAGRSGGRSSLLNPRSHAVWPQPPRKEDRAPHGASRGPPSPGSFGLCSWIVPVRLQSRRNKSLRAATFPDTAVSCAFALAISGIIPT